MCDVMILLITMLSYKLVNLILLLVQMFKKVLRYCHRQMSSHSWKRLAQEKDNETPEKAEALWRNEG